VCLTYFFMLIGLIKEGGFVRECRGTVDWGLEVSCKKITLFFMNVSLNCSLCTVVLSEPAMQFTDFKVVIIKCHSPVS
jgi:hypothetical protein